MMPKEVAEIRREVCVRNGCTISHVFTDPCESCLTSHWGAYGGDCEPIPKADGSPVKTARQIILTRSWPMILMPMKALAVEGDKGLGDIIARVIGPIGGDAVKEWWPTIFGTSCKCSIRQSEWNDRFPL